MAEHYLIAGLGNPGKEYENTRHNIGFRCVDALAQAHGITFERKTLPRARGRRHPRGPSRAAGQAADVHEPQRQRRAEA